MQHPDEGDTIALECEVCGYLRPAPAGNYEGKTEFVCGLCGHRQELRRPRKPRPERTIPQPREVPHIQWPG